jgi:phosphatidylglycerophosphatase A
MYLNIKRFNLSDPATWVATWFGSGFLRPAPGTWGTLAAIPFGYAIYFTGGVTALLAAIVLVTLLGVWATKRVQGHLGEHDNSTIVIDEVVGIWIVLCVTPVDLVSYGAAFALFRIFDVIKPFPISWLDNNIPGAWGVMIDDIAAGLVAAACVLGAVHAGYLG